MKGVLNKWDLLFKQITTTQKKIKFLMDWVFVVATNRERESERKKEQKIFDFNISSVCYISM